MSVIIVLVIVSVLVAGGFLAAFILSVKKGQYDDDYTPSVRMLFDDTPASVVSGDLSAKASNEFKSYKDNHSK
jgi:cbb3-type cytochrome oxidase maturation protein